MKLLLQAKVRHVDDGFSPAAISPQDGSIPVLYLNEKVGYRYPRFRAQKGGGMRRMCSSPVMTGTAIRMNNNLVDTTAVIVAAGI